MKNPFKTKTEKKNEKSNLVKLSLKELESVNGGLSSTRSTSDEQYVKVAPEAQKKTV